MAETKTKPTTVTVESFLENVTDPQSRADSLALIGLMEKVSGAPATMWGPSIIGFGKYRYKYDSGREGEMCLVGFSPRKGNISLYVKAALDGQAVLMEKLGKHKAAKGCVYIKKLSDVNLAVLEKIVANTISSLKEKYPDQ